MLNHHRLYIHFLIFLPSYLRKDHNTGFFITDPLAENQDLTLWRRTNIGQGSGCAGIDPWIVLEPGASLVTGWGQSWVCSNHRTPTTRVATIYIVCVCACNNFCVQTRLIWMWERNKHGCTLEMLTQPILSYGVGWVAQHQYVILQPQCLHLLPLIGV